MDDKLVTIARFTDNIQAEMAKQLLDDFGIKAIVTGQNVANVYAGVPAVMDLELLTFESHAHRARQILLDNEQKEL